MKPHYFNKFGSWFIVQADDANSRYLLSDAGGPLGYFDSVADAKNADDRLKQASDYRHLLDKLGSSRRF